MNWRDFTPEGQLLWPSAWRSLAVAWILIWSPAFTFVFFGGVEFVLRTGGSGSTLLKGGADRRRVGTPRCRIAEADRSLSSGQDFLFLIHVMPR
jgi:hypothetical protein